MCNSQVIISIIVPVYQVEKYISRCLRSLVYQTLKDIEIICICSKEDSSYSIIQEWCKSDSRIHLIEKQNTGVSSARNLGIAKANGEYIAFVDADDWIEKYAMETLYQIAEENQAQIIAYGMWPNVEPKGAKRGMFGCFPKENVKFVGHSMEALFYEHGSRPYIGNKFYNREFLLQNNLFFDENLTIGEDQLFQFDAFFRADVVCFVKEKLYHYDISRNNSTMNSCEKDGNIMQANLFLLQKVLGWKEKMLKWEYDVDFIWWILHDYSGWVTALVEGEKQQVAKELLNELEKLKVEEKISELPSVYGEMYQMISMYANNKLYNRKIQYDSHMADNYMLGRTENIKSKLLVKFHPFRRIHEIISFHEVRHFLTRIWLKMGTDYFKRIKNCIEHVAQSKI